MTDIIEIEHSLLIEDKTNYRRSMDRTKLDALKASIRFHGVMQNLEVQDIEGGDKKAVIIGNRRLRAVSELMKELPAEIKAETDGTKTAEMEAALSRIQRLNCRVLQGDAAKHAKERQLVENLQREEISPVDEAFGYDDLRKSHGLTIEEISKRVGMDKTPKYVANRLKLLRVPKRLLDALLNDAANVTIRMCERVGRIPSKEDREEVAEQILNPRHSDEPMRDSEVEELIRRDYVVPINEGGFDPADAKLYPVQTEPCQGLGVVGVKRIDEKGASRYEFEREEGKQRKGGGVCEDCPFRTGNDPALADELATGNDGKRGKKAGVPAQLCTNVGGCFSHKVDAAWEIIKKKAFAEGNSALKLEESEKQFNSYNEGLSYNSEFVDLKEKPSSSVLGHYDDDKVGKWEKLLEGTGIKVTYARHPRSKKIHRLVNRSTAVDAVNAKSKAEGKPSPFAKRSQGASSSSPTDKKKKAAERDKSQLEWATTYEMVRMAQSAVAANGINEDRAQAIGEIAINLAGNDGQFVLCKILNLEAGKTNYGGRDYEKPLVKHLTEITGERNKLAFAIVAMTMRYAKGSPGGTTDFKRLVKAYEIDRKSAEATVKAAGDAKKAKAKKPEAKPEMKSRSAAVRRNEASVSADESVRFKIKANETGMQAADRAMKLIAKASKPSKAERLKAALEKPGTTTKPAKGGKKTKGGK